MSMRTYTVECLSTALGPITHMSGTAGNVATIAREPVITERGKVWLPFLSGNALRHRCVREPGMLWLIDEYGLNGKLDLPKLNFLLHGGNLTKSTARENTKRIAEMHRTWPLLRLLGACLPDQILAGSMDVWRGTLVCEENRRHLSDCIGGLPSARLLPAERWVAEYQYTRSDAAKRGMAPEDANVDSNLMIYSGQGVQRGSMWHHGFVIKHVSDIELGALIWSLRLWQEAGGTIGGQASRGHGRLKADLILPGGCDQDKLCSAYVEYARDIKDDALAWLGDAWA